MSVFVLMTLTYPELKNVCRICLKKEDLYDLFILQCGDKSIKEIIEHLTGDVLIRTDETPDKICSQCMALLSTINTFLNTYKSTKSLYEDVIRKHWASADINVNYAFEVSTTETENVEPDLEDPLKIDLPEIKSEPTEIDDINNCELEFDVNAIKSECVVPKLEPEVAIVESKDNVELNGGDVAESRLLDFEKEFLIESNCKLCNFNSFNTIEDVKRQKIRHYSREHFINIQKNLLICIKCKTGFMSTEKLLQHYAKGMCESWLQNEEQLFQLQKRIREEIQENPRTKAKTYTCLKCDLLLANFEEMLQHFHDKHRSSSDVQTCMLCNTMLTTGGFFLHLMAHRPRWMKFYCRYCFLLFETMKELDAHEKETSHLYRNKYQCPCCKQHFMKSVFDQHFSESQD